MFVLYLLWFIPFVDSYTRMLLCPVECSCDDDHVSVDCRSAGLNELPDGLYYNVINLDLSYNEFETFPTRMEAYSELKYLNLSHNRISTLRYGDFDGLTNMLVLDFSYNLFKDWKDIKSGVFKATEKLEYLDFSNNALRSIPRLSNHFYIRSLKVLKLENCSIEVVYVELLNRLVNLEELYLSRNPFVMINDTLTLVNLKLLEISNSDLRYLNENALIGATSLEIFNLHNNTNLRQFTSHSMSLVDLDFTNSMLERVPNGRMRMLTKLNLYGNFLRVIPANSFANACNVQVLNLSTNAITNINENAFNCLNEVISIDLTFNKINTLMPKLFSSATSLTELNLSHNYLRVLDNIHSRSLKTLTVSYCEIQEIGRYSLIMLPKLKTLTLSRNFLTKLPDRVALKTVVTLDLSYCRINTLNNETFAEMYELRNLNLASNALTTIHPSYLPPTAILKVTIKENPWRCDCQRLHDMYQWIYQYSYNILDDLICSSPEQVEGQLWIEACSEQWQIPETITKDVMWYYSLAIVIAMVVALFLLIIIRKVKSLQEQRIRLADDARRAEERELLRRMNERQRDMEEGENRNAPDPRELQRPPPYNEAVLLPRLDTSHPSLADSFGSRGSLAGSNSDIAKKNRTRRKRQRRKSEEERRSRITVDSDSSDDDHQSVQSLRQSRKKPPQAPPLESDF